MMYRSDLKVLSVCKKMQIIEGDYFMVCENNEIRHCTGFGIDAVNRALKSEPGRKVKMEPSSFDACLGSLVESGMIKSFGTSPAKQVTHKGWNQREIIRRERREYIMTHALFPGIVSILTTLALWGIKALWP